jgi:Flp pilus assembly protein CpaB
MESAQRLISSRRGTIVLSVIAAAIAGGLILVYVSRYRDSVKSEGAPVTVLVARQTIPKGTAGNVIAAQSLYSATTLRQSQVLNGAYSDASSLRDKVATHDIFPNAQLTASDFAAASTNLAASLTGTERIVAIPVSSANGLSGELQAGDHVDVYVGFNVVPVDQNGVAVAGGQAHQVVRRVLTNIPVVAVAGKTSGVVSSGSSGGNISFKVDDQQAADLQFASENGVLWLALRPSAGAKSTPPSVSSMETLLLGVPPKVVLKDLGARR